ncbi:MAG: hypothetical protein WA851_04995 [Xanthobacteraceae bacterium]
MKAAIVLLTCCVLAAPAFAEEPVGCDKFTWPLDKERALLTSADTITVASGMKLALPLPVAVTIDLLPFADAKLPMPPERAPKQPSSFAGFVAVPASPQAGSYKVTLSSEAWIDVVQDGHFLKSTAHTGASGCTGIRKSVKFNLDAAPFVVQLSNVPANKIGVVITDD